MEHYNTIAFSKFSFFTWWHLQYEYQPPFSAILLCASFVEGVKPHRRYLVLPTTENIFPRLPNYPSLFFARKRHDRKTTANTHRTFMCQVVRPRNTPPQPRLRFSTPLKNAAPVDGIKCFHHSRCSTLPSKIIITFQRVNEGGFGQWNIHYCVAAAWRPMAVI